MTLKKNVSMLCAAILVSALTVGAQQLPAPGSAPAGSPVAKHGQLSVSGNKIKDKDGNDVVLRGVSFFWSNSDQYGWYDDAVVGWLVHDWNVSVVRAAMGVVKSDGGGNNGYADGDSAAQYNLVKNVVEASIKRGIYVLVDWHSHSAQNYEAKAKTFFQNIATAYGSYPNIIYETYNEPKDVGWSSIQSYSNTVTTAIRNIDSKNVIIIGTPEWSSQPNVSGNASGTHLAYSMHFYAASHGDNYRSNVTSALGMSRAVFVSEFGTCNYEGKGSHNGSAADTWITFLENNKVSWVNWAVSNKTTDGEATALFAGTNGSKTWTDSNKPSLTDQGSWSRTKIKGYNDVAYPPRTTYSITATQPATGGSITRTPSGNGGLSYNAEYSFTAVPDEGWDLVNWTGDASGSNATITGNVRGININVSAVFYNGGLIKNGHFTNGTTSWSFQAAGGTQGSITSVDGEMKIDVTAVTTSGDPRGVSQSGVSFKAGRKYKLTLEARTGSGSRNMKVAVVGRDTTTLALTTTKKTFEWEFNSATEGNAQLQFVVGDQTGTVIVDNIKLVDVGVSTGVSALRSSVVQRAWSISNRGGGVTLRGPAEAGAKVTLYDVRGKIVRSMSARDGMTLGANIPAGNYFVVVRNGAGKEVLRDKVSFVR